MLVIGQLKCVSYGVVCGMFYSVDSEKALISEDDHQELELRDKLHRFVVEARLGHFWNVIFSLIYAHCTYYFRHTTC